ncbi:MAG TPA: NUDIX pyrophosphatase [Bacillota bacterium]|nr:NUDIX pyrophosphatase [Bacillota bacterium]HOQ02648.1 NUDIX pyrophosphatase [Bacillota bacterium]HPP60268.1 NUDIX pyrophosphatase [Bacillota bacterium]HPV13467.1 NUDIX pyrophosphatase [Bacillota bacterium]
MVERINVQVFVFCKAPSFKVLILKRTPNRSGYWQPVCGGVDSGEELIEAALREIVEETGIENVKSIIDLEYTFTYKESKNGVLMHMQDFCFAVEVENIVDIKLSDEHEEYKWCSYSEAKAYLKWEHNLIALKKLMQKV